MRAQLVATNACAHKILIKLVEMGIWSQVMWLTEPRASHATILPLVPLDKHVFYITNQTVVGPVKPMVRQLNQWTESSTGSFTGLVLITMMQLNKGWWFMSWMQNPFLGRRNQILAMITYLVMTAHQVCPKFLLYFSYVRSNWLNQKV